MFYILYNTVIDLGKEFPLVAPTTFDRNPLTTFRWTPSEIEAFPRGIPGYPNTCFPPAVMPDGTMPEVTLPINEEVVKALDRSTLGLQALAIPRHKGRKPWRHPTNEQEVQLVRRVAQHPCNMLAFEFWGELVQRANSVAADARTPIQWTIARSIGARPLWAPFRAPKSRGSKAKARGRRTARPSEQGGAGETGETHNTPEVTSVDQGPMNTTQMGAPSNLEEQPLGELEDVDGMGPNDGMTIG